MDHNGGEVALVQQLVECGCALNALHEDHHLIELQRIQQVGQLAVLLSLLQLDKVLLQTVQSQARLVVDIDLLGL